MVTCRLVGDNYELYPEIFCCVSKDPILEEGTQFENKEDCAGRKKTRLMVLNFALFAR